MNHRPTDNRPRIERALDFVPDDMLLEACEEPSVTPVPRRPSQRKRLAVWGSLAASLVLVLVGAFIITRLLRDDPTVPPTPTPHTTIAFDVNPSLSIEVNTAERVAAVHALNGDAAAIVAELSVLDAPLDDAVDAIVASLMHHGYLTAEQNSILISVDTADGRTSETLQRRLADRIAAYLARDAIEASVITQDFDKDETPPFATDGDTSAAKAGFIQKILDAGMVDAYGNSYTYEQLESLTINDLKLLLQCKGIKVSGLTVWESGVGAATILSPEEAMSLVLADCGMDAEQIRWMHIVFDILPLVRSPVYQVHFVANGTRYEYCLLATSGDIIRISPAPDGTDTPPADFRPADYTSPRVASRKLQYVVSRKYGVTLREFPMEFKKMDGKFVYHSVFEFDGKRYEYVLDAADGEIISEKITLQADETS